MHELSQCMTARILLRRARQSSRPPASPQTDGGKPSSERLPEQVGTSWRVEGVNVPLKLDGGKDDYSVSASLIRALDNHLGVRGLQPGAP